MIESSEVTAPFREAAMAFGKKVSDKKFAGRKGHGGAPVSYITLDRAEVAALVVVAFEEGARTALATATRGRM